MQREIWENEYQNLSLVTGKPEPQKDVTRFLKFMRKQRKSETKGLKVLDLGSGTGRNTNYLQALGNECIGMEISETANNMAKSRAREDNLETVFLSQSIGDRFPFDDGYFDLLLDVTSSNSLDEDERSIYLSESYRVLKSGGYFFVKALCKEGDKNAQNLIKLCPGSGKDSYIMPELGLEERVFTREDFIDLYGKYFEILKLDKKTSYTQFNDRSYKRNFWIAYLAK